MKTKLIEEELVHIVMTIMKYLKNDKTTKI